MTKSEITNDVCLDLHRNDGFSLDEWIRNLWGLSEKEYADLETTESGSRMELMKA